MTGSLCVLCDGGSLQVYSSWTLCRPSAFQLHHDLRQVEEDVHGESRQLSVAVLVRFSISLGTLVYRPFCRRPAHPAKLIDWFDSQLF